MAYYIPPSEKAGGHVPRVPHQIAPMAISNYCLAALPANRVARCSTRNKASVYPVYCNFIGNIDFRHFMFFAIHIFSYFSFFNVSGVEAKLDITMWFHPVVKKLNRRAK